MWRATRWYVSGWLLLGRRRMMNDHRVRSPLLMAAGRGRRPVPSGGRPICDIELPESSDPNPDAPARHPSGAMTRKRPPTRRLRRFLLPKKDICFNGSVFRLIYLLGSFDARQSPARIQNGPSYTVPVPVPASSLFSPNHHHPPRPPRARPRRPHPRRPLGGNLWCVPALLFDSCI